MSTRLASCLLLVLAACETRPAPTAVTRAREALTESTTLGGVVRSAPLVAHVKVLSALGRAGTMGTAQTEALFTDLTLQVLAPVRGSADTLVLSTLGGRVGEREMHVSGQVALAAGDEAIVFADPSLAPHPFIGGQGGVLPVREGRVYSFDGRPLVEVRPAGFVFGRSAAAPALTPALEPQGSATATRVLPPEGQALPVAEVLAALGAQP